MLTAPPFVLCFQPCRQPHDSDHFHVVHHTLPIRILLIRDEFLHEVAGDHFSALDTEFKTFTFGASLDAAGCAKTGRFLAFASEALLILSQFSRFGRQQDWACTAIYTAITIKNEIHISPWVRTLVGIYQSRPFPSDVLFRNTGMPQGFYRAGNIHQSLV